jgi:hypothetical protein
MYEYQAIVLDVNPDCSLVLQLDLGFKLKFTTTARLYGLIIPEIGSDNPSTRQAAREAKLWLKTVLHEGKSVRFISHYLHKGCAVGTIINNEVSVNFEMIELGLAEERKTNETT